MEFAIGKVDSNNRRVKVLFYPDEKDCYTQINLSEKFPHVGRVFAPYLATDYPNIKTGDIVIFSYEEIPAKPSNEDENLFMIPNRSHGGKVYVCHMVLEWALEKIYSRTKVSDGDYPFFFFKEHEGNKYICGPLLPIDSRPKNGKAVKGWSYQPNYDTVAIAGTTYLTQELNNFTRRAHAIDVDCMDALQLKEWLKSKVPQTLSKEQLKHLQAKLKQIESVEESDALSKERFARIKKTIESISLDWNEIKSFKTLPGFDDVIDKSIEKNIEEIIKEEHVTISKIREKNEAEKELLEEGLTNCKKEYDKEKEKINNDICGINSELLSLEQKITNLSEHRDVIIESIKIQAELFHTRIPAEQKQNFAIPLERIKRQKDSEAVTNTNNGKFLESVNKILNTEPPWLTKIIVKNVLDLKKKAIQVKDIRTGIFLSAIFGNSVYTLVQPAPNWLSFSDFWDNALRDIWMSAHNYPDIWHFLLIENFNIACPECWGKPLWNIIEGKTKKMPNAEKAEYPSNLRIIVSIADWKEENCLGLPTSVANDWYKIPNINWDENDRWDEIEDIQELGINQEYFYQVK